MNSLQRRGGGAEVALRWHREAQRKCREDGLYLRLFACICGFRLNREGHGKNRLFERAGAWAC
jgi:hypothetical protein